MKNHSNSVHGNQGYLAMSNIQRLGVVGLSLLAMAAMTGCMAGEESKKAPTSVETAPNGPSSFAVVAHPGDVAPTMLQTGRPAVEAPKTFVTVSMPVPIGAPLVEPEATPVLVSSTNALKIAAKGVAEPLQKLPIDSTEGLATLYLGPQLDDAAGIEAALSGIKVFDPDGKQINLRAYKQTFGGEHPKPMSAIPLAQHPTGMYTIKLDPVAIKAGIAFDAHMPSATIAMQMKPSTYEHLLGNSDVVDMYLADGGAGIPGADVVGTLLDPDLKPQKPLVFKDLGQGHYQAAIDGSTFNASDQIGAWLVDIKASGKTATGKDFLRTGRTGFHFGIPTARVSSISDMRTLKDASGIIEAFEIDVSLESSALDRLEISATLAAKGSDGAEHPVVIAFAGDAYDPGTHTITLHFDAGNARATHMTGPYEIRNLKVFSLGTNTLFQRIGSVASTGFAAPKLTDLKPLAVIPPGLETFIDEGKLFKE
jgi:hypothetical protein